MKLRTVLPTLIHLLTYLNRKRKAKLYQQWVDRADLAPEAIPPEETTEDVLPEVDTKRLRQNIQYVLLGFFLGVFCFGLILLIYNYPNYRWERDLIVAIITLVFGFINIYQYKKDRLIINSDHIKFNGQVIYSFEIVDIKRDRYNILLKLINGEIKSRLCL